MTAFSKKFVWRKPTVDPNLSIMENILFHRLGREYDWDDFLSPGYQLADPFLMKGIKEAVERIKLAAGRKEKICVHGDYDTDGITSAVLVYELLKFLGFEVEIFIPNRYISGYGLRTENVSKIDADIILTVDCGIRDWEVVEKFNNIDFIITDHHQPGERLPQANAIINPHQPGCEYPYKKLAGVGVAFTLARGLLADWDLDEGLKEWWLKWHLDLVALGTVTDMMPLLGENRILVKYGLQVMEYGRRPGLNQILKTAGQNGRLSSYDLGFIIGPRINAAGRMGSAEVAVELLRADDEILARKLAEELNRTNMDRRTQVDLIMKEVMARIDPDDKVIMASSVGWKRGVVGLVAGRLMERYSRPVFLGEETDDIVVGSARGLGNVNVEKMMRQAENLLTNYGGHEQAGGFSMPVENWDKFVVNIKKQMENTKLELDETLLIDGIVKPQSLIDELWDDISRFQPIGVGNEEINLLTEGFRVIDQKAIGKEQDHIKFVLQTPSSEREALFWNAGKNIPSIKGNWVNIVYNLKENLFNQKVNRVLNVIDMEVVDG